MLDAGSEALADRIVVAVIVGAATTLTAYLLRRWSIARRLSGLISKMAPFLIGIAAAAVILVAAGPAVLTLQAVARGSGFLTGSDAELLSAVSGVSACEHQDPKSDAVAELACTLPGVADANIYRFAGATEMSGWFERFTSDSADDRTCQEAGRWTWSFEGGGVGGDLGCEFAGGVVTLWWTTFKSNVGGRLVASGGDPADVIEVWDQLSFGVPSADPREHCGSDGQVSWDNSGAGQDDWPNSTLHLSRVAACTTVMVSSAAFEVTDGPACSGGPTRVCVLVWHTQRGGEFRVGGLAAPGTWWGYTHSGPRAAIDDKSDLFNARGWFTSRNCTTGSGCDVAEVWIVNDGAATTVEVQHP